MGIPKIQLILLIAMNFAMTTHAANILLYPFGHCINSHLLNFEKLAGLLLERGHDVTLLIHTRYRGPHSNANLTQVKFIKFWSPDDISDICTFHSLQSFLETPLHDIVLRFYRSSHQFCDSLLSDKAALAAIKKERFDLAIYDAVDPCSRLLADYVDIPFVVFHTQGIENIQPRHPAYMPSMLTAYSDNMNIKQRVLNTIGHLAQRAILYMTLMYYTSLRIKHQVNSTLSLADSFNGASLRLVLGDHALDYVGPLHPSHVLVGGTIMSEKQPIPSKLLNFLDEAGDEGVAVLSFGSMVKYYGPHWREVFASALARLPMRVVWRYNEDSPESIGNNTMVVSWIPQADLLSHPNIKVFITHAGINAAFEAATYGVPVVAIPLFGDQHFQATKLTEHAGMGVKLDVHTLTEDMLYNAISNVQSDKVYSMNANRVSKAVQTKPLTQKELINFWVDSVLDSHGQFHLGSQEFHLTWYQYFLIDVISCLIFIVVGVYCLLKLMIMYTCKYLKCLVHRLSIFLLDSLNSTLGNINVNSKMD